jgi:sugar phosphate permease
MPEKPLTFCFVARLRGDASSQKVRLRLLNDDMDSPRRYENTLALVAILFFAGGTVFLDRMSQMYLTPYFAPQFHLSDQQIGSLASVLAISCAASTFFFGAL